MGAQCYVREADLGQALADPVRVFPRPYALGDGANTQVAKQNAKLGVADPAARDFKVGGDKDGKPPKDPNRPKLSKEEKKAAAAVGHGDRVTTGVTAATTQRCMDASHHTHPLMEVPMYGMTRVSCHIWLLLDMDALAQVAMVSFVSHCERHAAAPPVVATLPRGRGGGVSSCCC
mgnify:CR=1 FL=1